MMIGKTFDGIEVWLEPDHSITVWTPRAAPMAGPALRTQRPDELAALLTRAVGLRQEQMVDRLYPKTEPAVEK